MKKPVVIDSTCLIGLERIGKLDILPELFEPILIPDEVSNEFGVSFSWLNIEAPSNFTLVNALKLIVDSGEAEAIALAWRRNTKYFQTTNRRVRSPKGSVWKSSERSEC